jgi:hypothetical protein
MSRWSLFSLFDVMYLLIACSDDPVRDDALFALILMTQWRIFGMKLIVVDTVMMALLESDFDGSVYYGSCKKLDTLCNLSSISSLKY